MPAVLPLLTVHTHAGQAACVTAGSLLPSPPRGFRARRAHKTQLATWCDAMSALGLWEASLGAESAWGFLRIILWSISMQ